MQPQNFSNATDLDLVDQVIALIPEWTWTTVKQHLVTALVDSMPTAIIKRLTNDEANDDRAQEILDDYYAPLNRNNDLILDSFRILGKEQTLHMLDALQLDKLIKPID